MFVLRSQPNRTFFVVTAGGDIAAEILALTKLPRGWHYGSGVPVFYSAALAAVGIAAKLREYGASALEAFPEVEGGVLISAYRGDICIDALVRRNARVDITVERDDAEVFSETDMRPEDIVKALGKHNWLLGPSSGLSIRDTTVQSKSALNLLLSAEDLTAESLWSSNAAYRILDTQSAITSDNTTLRPSQGLRQSSFASRPLIYQPQL